MFIGYISSFYIALLLTLFYSGCAATVFFGRIRRETLEEPDEVYHIVAAQTAKDISSLVVIHTVADIPEAYRQSPFCSLLIDVPQLGNDDVPILKICLLEHFQRPPPCR